MVAVLRPSALLPPPGWASVGCRDCIITSAVRKRVECGSCTVVATYMNPTEIFLFFSSVIFLTTRGSGALKYILVDNANWKGDAAMCEKVRPLLRSRFLFSLPLFCSLYDQQHTCARRWSGL